MSVKRFITFRSLLAGWKSEMMEVQDSELHRTLTGWKLLKALKASLKYGREDRREYYNTKELLNNHFSLLLPYII